MFMRTHDAEGRRLVFGVDAIVSIVTILGTVVGGFLWQDRKLDAIIETQATIRENVSTIRAEGQATRDELARRVAAAEKLHETFLTKDVYYRDMAPEIRRPPSTIQRWKEDRWTRD